MSYSTFEYSNLRTEDHGDGLTVLVDVTNTGTMTAKEVVQVYVEPLMKPRLDRPVRELKAFTKVELEAGETKTAVLELTKRDFAYYDPAVEDWVVESGSYAVQIGRSCECIELSAAVEQTGEKYLPELRSDCGFHELFQYPFAREMFYDLLVEQGLVRKDQVDDKLEKGIIWSFWTVRSYLDMNSDGMISFEAYNEFLDRVNERIRKENERLS